MEVQYSLLNLKLITFRKFQERRFGKNFVVHNGSGIGSHGRYFNAHDKDSPHFHRREFHLAPAHPETRGGRVRVFQVGWGHVLRRHCEFKISFFFNFVLYFPLQNAFLNCFGDRYTFPILGPQVPLIWISSDVSSGFQSQSGFCLIHIAKANCNVHSPKSTSGATNCQPFDSQQCGAVTRFISCQSLNKLLCDPSGSNSRSPDYEFYAPPIQSECPAWLETQCNKKSLK